MPPIPLVRVPLTDSYTVGALCTVKKVNIQGIFLLFPPKIPITL